MYSGLHLLAAQSIDAAILSHAALGHCARINVCTCHGQSPACPALCHACVLVIILEVMRRDRDVLEELVHDVERHGYKGLIVTVSNNCLFLAALCSYQMHSAAAQRPQR